MALIATHPADPYPSYSRAELWADFLIHVAGAAFSIFVIVSLMSTQNLSGGLFVACLVYGLGLLFSNWAALGYHSLPLGGQRHIYRRLDHAAIFLLIAGAYTPFVVLIGTTFAYAILALIWVVALNLAIRRLFFWQTPGDRGYLWYLALGWAGLALVWSIYTQLPFATFILIITGGLCYSVGLSFYVQKQLKFSNAIWHGFVLLGSVSIYSALQYAL